MRSQGGPGQGRRVQGTIGATLVILPQDISRSPAFLRDENEKGHAPSAGPAAVELAWRKSRLSQSRYLKPAPSTRVRLTPVIGAREIGSAWKRSDRGAEAVSLSRYRPANGKALNAVSICLEKI